jgi:hypothetical protein
VAALGDAVGPIVCGLGGPVRSSGHRLDQNTSGQPADGLKSRTGRADDLGMGRLDRAVRRQRAGHVATVALNWLDDRARIFRRLGDRPDFDDWANSVTEAIEGRRMSAPESVSHSGTDTDPDGEGLHRPGGVESTRDRNSLRGRLNESGS